MATVPDWMRLPQRRLGDRVRVGFGDPQDALFIDAGISGELLVARVRIVLLLMLLLIQAIPPADPLNRRVALPLTVLALAVALAVYALASRRPSPWLGVVSSGADVTLVSLGLATFLFFNQPQTAVNSRALFDAYFLAIGCASLRYNWRVCVSTGMLAVVEYAALVSWAVARWHLDSLRPAPFGAGTFDWSVQGARVILLVAAAVLAVFIVLRAQRLQQMSATDRLTGVFNRSFFEQQLTDEMDRGRRYARPFAVALIDIDQFKSFNDTHGHAGGDAVLRAVAQVLRRSMRKSDVVARYGGEEFVILLPEATAALVMGKLESMRHAVAEAKVSMGKRKQGVGVTVSIGVASWPDDGVEVEDVVTCADERLYEAKRRGRDCIVGPPISQEPSGR